MSVADRVRETLTGATDFTGQKGASATITLPGSASSGYDPFSRRYTNGTGNIPVIIAHRSADEWQACLCTYTSSNLLTVNTIVATSEAADAAPSFTAGDKDIYVAALARNIVPATTGNTIVGNSGSGLASLSANTAITVLNTATNTLDFARLDGVAASSHTHGNITNAGAIGSTANLPVITTTSGVLTTGTFGTGANTFAQGNDSRLSDTRTPTDGTVSTAKIQDDAVTYAKIQNVSATDRLLGRSTAGAGDVEEITCTAAGRALIDDADAAAQRQTLGVPYRDTSNVFPDPDFMNAAFYTADGGGALSTVGAVLETNSSVNTGAGTQRLRIDSNASDRTVVSDWFVVTPSTAYEFECMASQQGTTDSTQIDVDLEEGSLASGAVTPIVTLIPLVTATTLADVSQSGRHKAVFTTTSTARRARLRFKRRGGNSNSALFGRPEIRRAFLQLGTGAKPRTSQEKMRDFVNVLDFMTAAEIASVRARDGSADVTTAIQNAINSLDAGGGGTVFFPPGVYKVTSTLTANTNVVRIEGASVRSTVLQVNHTSGPAIEMKYYYSGVAHMTIQGSTDRRDAAAGTNYGVFFPTDTNISTSRFGNYVRDCIINNHSSHGVYATGQGWVVEDCRILDCGGHGVYLDNFDADINMVAGFCEIKNTQIANIKGHGVCGGLNRMVFRVVLENVDAFKCLTDASVRQSTFVLHLDKAENVVIRSSGWGGWVGDSPNRVPTHSGIYINGKGARVYNNRFIDIVTPAIKLGANADGSIIENCHIDGEEQGNVDPLIEVVSGCTGLYAVQPDTTKIVRVATPAAGNSGNIAIAKGIPQQGFRSHRSQQGIADDAVIALAFTGPTRGIVVLAGNSSTAGGAVVAFRTGDASAYCSVIAGPATTVGATIGSEPTGTSGVDGNLTVYARTDATYTLHFNNRRGVNIEVMPTFLSLFNGEQILV